MQSLVLLKSKTLGTDSVEDQHKFKTTLILALINSSYTVGDVVCSLPYCALDSAKSLYSWLLNTDLWLNLTSCDELFMARIAMKLRAMESHKKFAGSIDQYLRFKEMASKLKPIEPVTSFRFSTCKDQNHAIKFVDVLQGYCDKLFSSTPCAGFLF